MTFNPLHLGYLHPSHVKADLDEVAIHLSPDQQRPSALFQGSLRQPLHFREALSTLYLLQTADSRYKSRDRTAYLQYLQRQAAKSSTTAKTAARLRKAEQLIREKMERGESEDPGLFDPLMTVHPDEFFFEVFSKDESTYARLSVRWESLADARDPVYGTTQIDFSPELFDALQRLRSYRKARLLVEPPPPTSTSPTTPALQKDLRLPDSWLRGFLQVQSAALLPMTSFQIEPIDLYNALAFLRRHRETKSPRGLRFELIPGQSPKLILEPWETLFPSNAPAFSGMRPQIVRLWGRRRLSLLARLLPFTEAIHIYTLGSGLPTFFVFSLPQMTFTLGLSGWTSSDWSASAQFDRFLPNQAVSPDVASHLAKTLSQTFTLSLADVMNDFSLTQKEAISALHQQIAQGRLLYDLHTRTFRSRPLTPFPLDTERLRFRNEREESAHRLLRTAKIQITKLTHILGSGLAIHGEVEDPTAFRTYRASFVFDPDGRITSLQCSSPWFQRTQGKEGPSEYLLALLLFYSQKDQDALQKAAKEAGIILAETRAFTRRHNHEETLYQLTLDHRSVLIQWGLRAKAMRSQKLLFHSPDEARREYQTRIASLQKKGFAETQA